MNKKYIGKPSNLDKISEKDKYKFDGFYDYDTKPYGDGNPYHYCSSCERSVPEINGNLLNHFKHCEFRKKELSKLGL